MPANFVVLVLNTGVRKTTKTVPSLSERWFIVLSMAPTASAK